MKELTPKDEAQSPLLPYIGLEIDICSFVKNRFSLDLNHASVSRT
jgi:hypothetical protein